MFRKNSALALVASLCFTASAGIANAAGTQVVTDVSGNNVTVPTTINAIGDNWPAHLEVLAMLGVGDKVASYVNVDTPDKRPWLAVVNPQMRKASPAFTKTDVNVEEMMKQKPDVVFTMISPRIKTKLDSLGIPDVQVTFSNFEEVKKIFNLTAKVLGPEAEKRATAYNNYLDSKLQEIRAYTSTLPDNRKPRVLHVVQLDPLTIDGGHSLIDAWIRAAGGINVAEAVHGSLKVTSKEQLLAWNPDVVIFGASSLHDLAKRKATLKGLETDPMWSNVKAVKDHKLYVNPDGAYLWDRYSAETALQVQWAAKLLHPNHFKDLDMAAETRSFYHDFLNYDLSDTEVSEILQGVPPHILKN